MLRRPGAGERAEPTGGFAGIVAASQKGEEAMTRADAERIYGPITVHRTDNPTPEHGWDYRAFFDRYYDIDMPSWLEALGATETEALVALLEQTEEHLAEENLTLVAPGGCICGHSSASHASDDYDLTETLGHCLTDHCACAAFESPTLAKGISDLTSVIDRILGLDRIERETEAVLSAEQKERRHNDEMYQNDLQRRSGC